MIVTLWSDFALWPAILNSWIIFQVNSHFVFALSTFSYISETIYNSVEEFIGDETGVFDFEIECYNTLEFMNKVKEYCQRKSASRANDSMITPLDENNFASPSSPLQINASMSTSISLAVSSSNEIRNIYPVVDNTANCEFIKDQSFSLANFTFPPFDASFAELDKESVSSDTLQTCDFDKVMLGTAQKIFGKLKLVFPNSVPPKVLEKISAAFTWEYKQFQINYSEMKRLENGNVKLSCVDVGVSLICF